MTSYEIFSYTTGVTVDTFLAPCWEGALAIRAHEYSNFYGVRKARQVLDATT